MFGSLSTLGPLLAALGVFLKSVDTSSLADGSSETGGAGSLGGLLGGSSE
ncbi:hypothetical protein [Rhodococcus sp. IEGM 1379]|nr:hypothetical protein [Rhodococcus sp. IEGM 1379]MDI9916127.1 hypothetical protein [Rhodococcus sp. IEGM 1379]